MMDINGFLNAISQSFQAYNAPGGARSNKKLIPIHEWVARTIEKELNKKSTEKIYTVDALGISEEKTLKDAKYYPKTLDIAIAKAGRIIVTVSLKFIMSNYKQNSNNYFETLLGETANIRRAGVGFAHLLIMPKELPYLNKNSGNKRGEIKKIEKIEKKHLYKYMRLFDDSDFPHKPDVLGITIINYDEKSKKTTLSNLQEFELDEKHTSIFSLAKFIEKTVALVALKS